MSSLGSPNSFFLAGKKAYQIERSVRYNRPDNHYFSKQPSSAGNRRTFTISLWVKRSNTGVNGALFYAGTSVGANHDDTDSFRFDGSDQLTFEGEENQSVKYAITTNRKFRDPSAWYHIVLAVDTTQATSSNRIKFYVNGVQETSFATETYPSQNYELFVNSTVSGGYTSGNIHVLGYTGGGRGLDGYLAEYHLIDGFQYDPSYFGETNAITGQWNPKKYIGGYGTNGFYLNFLDNSGTTATTLGKDSSGNGNNYTPNNFSVSAGIGNDSLEDTPTNNFPTLNALDKLSGGNTSSLSLSEGNLKVAAGSGGEGNVNMTTVATIEIPTSGKWYWEVHATDVATAAASRTHLGIINQAAKFDDGLDLAYADVAGAYAYAADGSKAASPGNFASYGASYTDNDIIGVAVDADNGSIAFYKNGASQGTAYTGLDMSEGFMPVVGYWGTFNINFGQRAFDYTVPTGYKNLSSANLPNPTILLPNKHFDILTYAGNSTDNRAITGLNFQPDWVWIKKRTSSVATHWIVDALRANTDNSGNGNVGALASNSSDGEQSHPDGGFESFDSSGFTLGKGSNNANADSAYQRNNASSMTYVAWNWDAGETDGKTYTVTVVSDSGNKYRFDGFGTSAVTLDLAEGGTYIFNYPSAHPFRFSETADGTHGGGSEYTTGVTVLSSTSIQIVVAASAPNLNYYCSSHSGMGGAINTNSTLGSSNFDGTGQVTAKVNAQAGFSILTYSGTGSAGTKGHGLGVAPQAIITKRKSGAEDWKIYHQGIQGGYFLKLNATQAETSNSDVYPNTAPTSSVYSLGNHISVNASGSSYVSYCFSEVAGYSKFGNFTGNGSSDGTFIFTGFKPAWLMIKAPSQSSGYWLILDSTRRTFNPNGISSSLYANETSTENTFGNGTGIDFLSNGFKIRDSLVFVNASGQNIIYFAFAESPFKNARAV